MVVAPGVLPEPINSVITAPEVITALTLVVVSVLTLLTVKTKSAIKRVDAGLQVTKAEATRAADHAAVAQEQVANTHTVNLRDDLDAFRELVTGELGAIREEQKADAEARERRDRRAEDQIDGLRDDVRQLTERADRDHRIIHERINALKAGQGGAAS